MTSLYDVIGLLPSSTLQLEFMQRALLGLLLTAPLTTLMGVQVLHFRMAFFSDAISHSAFAGAALGLLLSLNPDFSMPLFGGAVGIGIILVKRNSLLSSDTVIGVFFAAVMAFGLAIISRTPSMSRNVQAFLYGDILTIDEVHLVRLAILAACILIFQMLGYNALTYIGLSPTLAGVHNLRVRVWQYGFAALLAVLVMFSVQAVGVFLVTSLLIVPAAAARLMAATGRGMVWWALGVSLLSSVTGLLVSAQPWAGTATGATIVLAASLFFLAALGAARFLRR